jgi:hypothetical protein
MSDAARGEVIINPQSADQVGRRVNPSDVDHPVVLCALKAWNERRGGDAYPSKDAMTPQHMKPFLRNVILVRVLDDGADYEYRLCGDAAIVAFGRDYKGCRIADLNRVQPGYGDVMARLYGRVRKSREPIFVRGLLTRSDMSLDEQQAVFLPLGTDAGVDHILYVGGYTHLPPVRPRG